VHRLRLCAWACPYGAREMDGVGKVMKKCTLCVDRIYNENLPRVEEREPACVRTCPAKARHFGDLGDPKATSRSWSPSAAASWPDAGARLPPVNKYLREKPPMRAHSLEEAAPTPMDIKNPLLRWLDRALAR
jgi:sulfite dehydrogenase (quinone) subunit SoeB